MSILNRTDLQADRSRPLYVKFDKATRTQKDSGVTLFGTVAKFGDGSDFKFEGDRITLYDSHFGPPDKECALTNPCMIFKDGEYWSVREVDGKEIAYESPKLAPKPDPKPAWGGGGGGGGGKSMTRDQLDAAIAYSLHSTIVVCSDADGFNCKSEDATAAIFAKILGCAMFVDWPTSPGGQVPEGSLEVADTDIPFAPDAPRGGLL